MVKNPKLAKSIHVVKYAIIVIIKTEKQKTYL